MYEDALNPNFVQKVPIENKWKISARDLVPFGSGRSVEYLSVEVSAAKDGWTLSQQTYCDDLLSKWSMQDCRPISSLEEVPEHIEDEDDIANVKLSHATQTLIVEAASHLPDPPDHGPPHKMRPLDMPNHGMMLKSWLKDSMPFVLWRGEDCITIIHSIEPYHKRAREEA